MDNNKLENNNQRIIIHYTLIILLLVSVYVIVYTSNYSKPSDTLAVFFALFLAKFLFAFNINKITKDKNILNLHRTFINTKVEIDKITDWSILKLPDRKLLLDEKNRNFYILSINTQTKSINYPIIGLKEKYKTKNDFYYALTNGILPAEKYKNTEKDVNGMVGLKYILWYIFI